MLLFKKQQKDTDFLVTPKLLFSNPTKQSDKKEYKPSKGDLMARRPAPWVIPSV
jgi:hypothetical protein